MTSRPSKGRGVDQKGRSKKGERFLQLPFFMLQSAAWQCCVPIERALFIEVAQRFNGFNNGKIGLGIREAGRALHVKHMTAAKAFITLQERGFIVLETNASFDQKRLAREWRVTCFHVGDPDRPASAPSNDFMRWRPKKQNADPFGDPVWSVSGPDVPEKEADSRRNGAGRVPKRTKNASPNTPNGPFGDSHLVTMGEDAEESHRK